MAVPSKNEQKHPRGETTGASAKKLSLAVALQASAALRESFEPDSRDGRSGIKAVLPTAVLQREMREQVRAVPSKNEQKHPFGCFCSFWWRQLDSNQ